MPMNPLGTLKVGDQVNMENEETEKKFNTFNVDVSVKKPNFDVLRSVETAAMVLLIFEAVFTVAVIGAIRDWYCAVFLIPALFRYGAFPSPTSTTYMLPSFILLHSMIIAVEAALTIIGAVISYQVTGWNAEYAFLTVSLAGLSVVLIVRFSLAVVQQTHYNRVWMSHILSKRSYFFNLV